MGSWTQLFHILSSFPPLSPTTLWAPGGRRPWPLQHRKWEIQFLLSSCFDCSDADFWILVFIRFYWPHSVLTLWLSVGVCVCMRARACICVCFCPCGEQNQTGGGGAGEKNRKMNTNTCSMYKPRTTGFLPKNVTFYSSWNNAIENQGFTVCARNGTGDGKC